LAAWEIYKYTGERSWLKKAFEIIKNTLADDAMVLANKESDMYRGESSFLDWREQTYPKWMSNKDIYISQNLGTNAVHYKAHRILAEMAKILDEPHEIFDKRAELIKNAINDRLWLDDQGFYAQYLYGRNHLVISPRFEALGEALSILFEIPDKNRQEQIVKKSPLTPFGTSCIYPQIPNIPPYHNNGIWPFVQSYWNLAAAKVGNEDALNHGLASIYRAGALFLTNYENFVAENGDFKGTEINSDRMLWSMAGNLAMVHRVFIGMNFEIDGIRFNPVIPKNYNGIRYLKGFKYRNAVLNITVEGFGNEIDQMKVNEELYSEAFIPAELEGEINIFIKMKNTSFDLNPINLVDNAFSLPNPRVSMDENLFEIEDYTNSSLLPFSNYSGEGFIEISNDQNTLIKMEIDQNHAGNYMAEFRYSNGSGPWNTNNKCAIRSLYCNDEYVGSLVFPQRGLDEWSEWGWSNSYILNLNEGRNVIEVKLEPWNTNMNVEINRAMLDYLRLIEK
jgi:hypothetical protein